MFFSNKNTPPVFLPSDLVNPLGPISSSRKCFRASRPKCPLGPAGARRLEGSAGVWAQNIQVTKKNTGEMFWLLFFSSFPGSLQSKKVYTDHQSVMQIKPSTSKPLQRFRNPSTTLKTTMGFRTESHLENPLQTSVEPPDIYKKIQPSSKNYTKQNLFFLQKEIFAAFQVVPQERPLGARPKLPGSSGNGKGLQQAAGSGLVRFPAGSLSFEDLGVQIVPRIWASLHHQVCFDLFGGRRENRMTRMTS